MTLRWTVPLLLVAACGGGRLEQTGPATTAVDGTWAHVGDDVVFTYLSRSGTPVPKRYQEVPGVAVGEWLYERIDQH